MKKNDAKTSYWSKNEHWLKQKGLEVKKRAKRVESGTF